MPRVFVALGSNLHDPVKQLQQAMAALRAWPSVTQWISSSLYRTPPMGPQDQPDYINAVVGFQTEQSPLTLLAALQDQEQQQGRVREGERWGPRTLDLDLLLYGDETLDLPSLVVPHPGLTQRDFVLVPLYEIAPDLQLPDGSAVAEHWRRCTQGCHTLQRIENVMLNASESLDALHHEQPRNS